MVKYIIFDTETTGNQEQDRIIQVGAMILHGREIEVYDELCSTEQKISIEAMEVHNITPDMIEDKDPFGLDLRINSSLTYELPNKRFSVMLLGQNLFSITNNILILIILKENAMILFTNFAK